MVEITIKLPDMLAHTFGATPEARSQRLAEDAAIEEYRSGRLSHRQVGDSLSDLQADRVTLDEVLGLA